MNPAEQIGALALGIVIILIILVDAFEAILLPRRISRRVRLIRYFFLATFRPWAAIARRLRSRRWRDAALGVFGPISMVFLLAMWAGGLCVGFALIHWTVDSWAHQDHPKHAFLSALYISGTTFFTLGVAEGDAESMVQKALTVLEGGLGFGFLAIVIGYMPVLYNLFSSRELFITMLDTRAGSPPSASILLSRLSESQAYNELGAWLRDAEKWCAEVLETHLSYPVLSYYRSQHDNQSWIAALTMIMDTCALVIMGIDGIAPYQARMTFAMGRHALVDVSSIFHIEPLEDAEDRLPPEKFSQLRELLTGYGVRLREGPEAEEQLTELRRAYEPFVLALAKHLVLTPPPWLSDPHKTDNWQRSAWGRVQRDTLQ